MKELVDCYRGDRFHHRAWVVQVLGVGVHGEDACAENSYIEFEVIEFSTSTVEPRLMQPKLQGLQYQDQLLSQMGGYIHMYRLWWSQHS